MNDATPDNLQRNEFFLPAPIVAQNGNIVVSFIVRTAYLETHVTLHLKQNSTLALSREKVDNFFTSNKRAVMIECIMASEFTFNKR